MRSTVSVCIPVYNGERFIRAALASVVKQTAEGLEIVVLDNASTDATSDIVAEFAADPRVRIERNDTLLPLPDNWRRAVELCRGDLVKIVCADDLLYDGCLATQQRILDAHPDVSLVASRRDVIDEHGELVSGGRGMRGLLGPRPGRAAARQAVWLGHNPIGESAAVMFRRADYEAVGGFDGSLVYPMDLDLWLKLLQRGALWGQRETLAAYRVSSTSLTAAFTPQQYREQVTFMRRLAADPYWRLSPVARAAARVSARASLWSWSLRHDLLDRRHRRRGAA